MPVPPVAACQEEGSPWERRADSGASGWRPRGCPRAVGWDVMLTFVCGASAARTVRWHGERGLLRLRIESCPAGGSIRTRRRQWRTDIMEAGGGGLVVRRGLESVVVHRCLWGRVSGACPQVVGGQSLPPLLDSSSVATRFAPKREAHLDGLRTPTPGVNFSRREPSALCARPLCARPYC